MHVVMCAQKILYRWKVISYKFLYPGFELKLSFLTRHLLDNNLISTGLFRLVQCFVCFSQ